MLLAYGRFHMRPVSPAIMVSALFGILIQADGANPSIQRIGDIAFFRSLKIAEREALEIMFLEP